MTTLKYKYTNIKDLNTDGYFNFYGVIYDATFPVFDDKENSYSATVKIIDQEVNCLSHPETLNDNIVYLNIKSSDKENLPFIHSIGDIVRVHRGNLVNRINIFLGFKLLSLALFLRPKIFIKF
jgi:hypothetical protein